MWPREAPQTPGCMRRPDGRLRNARAVAACWRVAPTTPREIVGRCGRPSAVLDDAADDSIGQNLARVTMEIALATLLERLPGLRLAVAAEDIPFNPTAGFQVLNELPVAW